METWLGDGYTVIDTETTGVDRTRDRILEVGVARVPGDLAEAHIVVDPLVPVPDEITKLTGITQAEVDAVGWDPTKAMAWLDRQVNWNGALVGHNFLGFDLPFLIAWARWGLQEPLAARLASACVVDTGAMFKGWRLGLRPLPDEHITAYCTRVLGMRVAGLKFNLATACETFGIDVSDVQAHRAGGDVIATARLLDAMLPLFREWSSTLRVVCAWCGVVLHEGRCGVSHGICRECKAKQLAGAGLPF